MGSVENDIKYEILKELGKGDVRLWNAPTGGMTVGDRFFRFGMVKGGSDIIGIRKRVIKLEDVGRDFGQFVAIECKTQTGRATEEQLNFINQVRGMGALAGIARTVGEAKFILGSWETYMEAE